MKYSVEIPTGVELANTLVTVTAWLLGIFLGRGLQKWLSRRFWESTAMGRPTDMLLSGDVDGLKEFYWKVRHSAGSDRKRVICDLLPYVFVIAVLQLVSYSTSGVSATVSTKQGRSVTVIGSPFNATAMPIETLSVDALVSLRQGEVEGGAAPLLLGAPELGNYGTSTTGLEWSLTFSTTATTDESPNLTIYGTRYTVEQDGEGNGTYTATTCLVVSEDEDDYRVGTCEGVDVDLESIEVVVEGVQIIRWLQTGCENSTSGIFNRRVTFNNRSLILDEWSGNFTESEMVGNTTVSALCANIHESVIEACIFEVGDHIYIGDWDTSEIDTACGETTSPFYPGPGMYTAELKRRGGTLLANEEFRVAASMLAEIVAGSGTIRSTQKLALILGVFSRMAGMKKGVVTAYYPESVVIVSISYTVFGLWSLLLMAGFVVHLRERCFTNNGFIPSSAWDWYAVGARECLRGDDASHSEPPADHDYAAKYGLRTPWANDLAGGVEKRLTWV